MTQEQNPDLIIPANDDKSKLVEIIGLAEKRDDSRLVELVDPVQTKEGVESGLVEIIGPAEKRDDSKLVELTDSNTTKGE